MIDQSVLVSWPEIFQRVGEPEPRRGRARCPIHNGDSRTSLSVSEDKGFYCHVCHSGGDKLDFIQAVLRTDFRGAMRWFGLDPGQPPKPDPASVRGKAAMDQVGKWNRTTGRRLRDEYLDRQRIIRYAEERLASDPEDELGWRLLQVAFDGEAKNEFLLDEIDLCRDDDERLRVWREYKDEI